MAVMLRMQPKGKKNARQFRIVAIDSRRPRDGKFLDIIAFYNPNSKLPETKVQWKDLAILHHWLNVGAQPCEKVEALLKTSLLNLGPLLDERAINIKELSTYLAIVIDRFLRKFFTISEKESRIPHLIQSIWKTVSTPLLHDPHGLAAVQNLILTPAEPKFLRQLSERLAVIIAKPLFKNLRELLRELHPRFLTRAKILDISEGQIDTGSSHFPGKETSMISNLTSGTGYQAANPSRPINWDLRLNCWLEGRPVDECLEKGRLKVGQTETLFATIECVDERALREPFWAPTVDVVLMCSSCCVETRVRSLPLPPVKNLAAQFQFCPEKEGPMTITLLLLAKNDHIFEHQATLQVSR